MKLKEDVNLRFLFFSRNCFTQTRTRSDSIDLSCTSSRIITLYLSAWNPLSRNSSNKTPAVLKTIFDLWKMKRKWTQKYKIDSDRSKRECQEVAAEIEAGCMYCKYFTLSWREEKRTRQRWRDSSNEVYLNTNQKDKAKLMLTLWTTASHSQLKSLCRSTEG